MTKCPNENETMTITKCPNENDDDDETRRDETRRDEDEDCCYFLIVFIKPVIWRSIEIIF